VITNKTNPRTEDEIVIYSHLSKLFRMRNKEWKERCLGNVQILKEKNGTECRIVMKQEKTGKVS
jgi:hypothetical protein